MFLNRPQVVIDFGTSKISTAIGKKTSNEIDYFGLGVCEYAGFRDGMWVSPDDVEESIFLSKKDAEQQSGRRIRNANVIIPGEFSMTCFSQVSIKPGNIDGRITYEDIDKLIEIGAKEINWPDNFSIINVQPVVYLLDGLNRRQLPVGQYARTIEAYISYTAVDSVFVDNITHLLDNLGMGVEGYFSSTNSLAYYLSENAVKKTNVIIDTGYYSTDIIICEGDCVIAHDNVAVGGFHITSDLMVHLNKDRYIAEQIKRNCSIGMDSLGLSKIMLDENNQRIQFSVEKTQNVVENRIVEILNVVSQNANNTGVDLVNRCGIYITGGGLSRTQGAREMCSRILGQNVAVFKPNRPIQANVQMTSLCAGFEYLLNDMNKGIHPYQNEK